MTPARPSKDSTYLAAVDLFSKIGSTGCFVPCSNKSFARDSHSSFVPSGTLALAKHAISSGLIGKAETVSSSISSI